MNFNWEKYLELAEYMIKNADNMPDKYACYRASASRAYYAAFCITYKYIREKDGKEFTENVHQQVRKHLEETGDKLKRTIANQLKDAHKNRIKADYRDNIRESVFKLAWQTIDWSKKIINGIEQLSVK